MLRVLSKSHTKCLFPLCMIGDVWAKYILDLVTVFDIIKQFLKCASAIASVRDNLCPLIILVSRFAMIAPY